MAGIMAGNIDEGESVCIGICVIGEDGRCEGCGRTEDEIYGTPAPAAEAGAGSAG